MDSNSCFVQLRKYFQQNPGAWVLFESYLQAEIMDTYKQLANTETKPNTTEQCRGKAAFIKKFLSVRVEPTTGPLT